MAPDDGASSQTKRIGRKLDPLCFGVRHFPNAGTGASEVKGGADRLASLLAMKPPQEKDRAFLI